jgi:hypothetical protein
MLRSALASCPTTLSAARRFSQLTMTAKAQQHRVDHFDHGDDEAGDIVVLSLGELRPGALDAELAEDRQGRA